MRQGPTLTLLETLKLHWVVFVPFLLRGITVPNRWAAGLAVWIANRNRAQAYLDSLARKYRGGVFNTRFLFSRTVLVVKPAEFDEILASVNISADPPLKKRALSQFLPDALTVLGGEHWVRQRLFNSAILDTGQRHRFADAFHQVIDSDIASLSPQRDGHLCWRDFEGFATRIAQQVMFGTDRTETALGEHLAFMAARSNLIVRGRHRRTFGLFHTRMNQLIADAVASGQRCRGRPPSSDQPACLLTAVGAQSGVQDLDALPALSSQLGFWLLVLKDTLELHLPRTLALIAAHPEIQRQLQQQIDSIDMLDGAALDQLGLLDRCISEQLRLWTPVPFLFRRAQSDCALKSGARLVRNRQIVLLVGYYHRDADTFRERADRFSPDSEPDNAPPTYSFSADRQSCAGEDLARLLLKSALVAILARYTVTLCKPGIDTRRIPAACNHYAVFLKTDQRNTDHGHQHTQTIP